METTKVLPPNVRLGGPLAVWLLASLVSGWLSLGSATEAASRPETLDTTALEATLDQCAAPTPGHNLEVGDLPTHLFLGTSDCPLDLTNPGPDYVPVETYEISVVVHVIMDSTCTDGVVSDETVASQIEILNEDFLAKPGTPGAAGADSRIEFVLADVDPDGLPTNGITRDCNTTWYNDGGQYWESLAWAPSRYLNLYTNTAANARGYVPFLPAVDEGAMVGSPEDRVVVNWLVFGRDSPFPPHDQGRTATHEVGHYLGLFHTYFAGCGDIAEPLCYSTGDRLCDTPPNAMSHDECPVGATSCGGIPVPIENYMELTDDLCMSGFTFEQAQRMRCTLLTYRSELFHSGLFADDFESGGTSAWSSTTP